MACLLRFVWILFFYKSLIKRWHTADGEIISNSIEYEDSNSDGGWKNEIGYTFTVGDSIIHSTCFSRNIGLLHPFKENVEIDESYTIGKSVLVYYNPKNPKDSVIELFSIYNLSYILMSIVCFVIAYMIY